MPRIVNLAGDVSSNENLCLATAIEPQIVSPYTSSTINYLQQKYPNQILFTIEDVADELNVSYEFVRSSINRSKIKALDYGKRKMVHFNELTIIISEGIK